MKPFINISAYKFVALDSLVARRAALLSLCNSFELKGTILIAHEGINLFVAGTRNAIDSFVNELQSNEEYAGLPIKESESDEQPFNRMLVRIKKEIISMGVPEIQPGQRTSPKLSATELKKWLDEGRDIALLDVRNDYEVDLGTFEKAMPINVDSFRDFPDAVRQLPVELKEKPVVMFCTGGIRCEKAGPLMERAGFENVFQLDGGILRYFEDCGGDHYKGECFVFDQRVAVRPDLQESVTTQCYACRAVVTAEDQQSEKYDPPNHCPHCYQEPEARQRELLEERENLLAKLTTPLPGSQPYDNIRPMNVPLKMDGRTAVEFLCEMHPHLTSVFWNEECTEGRVQYKDQPLSANDIVQASWRIEHHRPQTTEPNVNNQVRFLFEDNSMIAVSKPAPLPMHPSGRFNRNTLIHFLHLMYEPEKIRIVHRLDSETTGVVLFGRKREASKHLQRQFAEGTIEKTYLARVWGRPNTEAFRCDQPIAANANQTDGTRSIDDAGLESLTEFKLIKTFDDGTSLLECRPITGRTNQIRIHLQHLGLPIVGDKAYADASAREIADASPMLAGEMCLHAWRISLDHPVTGERMTLEDRVPQWAHPVRTCFDSGTSEDICD